jgi:undecaprenyl-diphosphatase
MPAASGAERKDPWLSRLGAKERGMLLSVLILFALAWVVFEAADLSLDGQGVSLDRQILLSLRDEIDTDDPIGPPWAEESARDITALGGVAVLSLITVAVSAYLFLRRKARLALIVVLTVASGNMLTLILKAFFDRPRPTLVSHESLVYTASFPSGHSMMAAVTYFTLAALLIRVEKSRRIKAFFFFVSLILTVSVGISRVYLGVHWPSDVLAGWALGIGWAFLSHLLAGNLQKQGKVETA